MAMIEIKNISKWYGSFQVLKDCSVNVEKGEVVVVCGPSGSGKSTLIKTVNALEPFQKGEIIVDGISVGDPKTDLPKLRSRVGMVFQHFELFPHLSIRENLVLAQMKVLGRGREEATERGLKLLDRVGLLKHADKFPGQLSGGQQQRVAIARALVSRPRVLLLDEPLAALDLKLRKDMQQELKNIQKATGITFVFVTHDQEEALSMSDTIVVMSEGRIQQIGTPIDIYNEPENAFVADFIGESNIVDGIMRKDFSVTFSGHTFTCVDKGFAKNENVDVVIRPEDVDIVPIEQGMLRGTVTSITFMGVHYEIIIDINGFKWMIQTTDYVDEGAEVGLYIEPDAIHIMKKSEYSGMYGDYSSFSNELDELSDAESEPDE